jgi:hypothetical protein
VRYLPNGDREIRTADGALQRVVRRGDTVTVSKKDTAHLVLGDPERVAAVRRIFELYVRDGHGLGGVARRLNAEGVPTATRTNGRWSASTVREMLRNRAYTGSSVWNRRTYAKFHRVTGGAAQRRPKTEKGRLSSNPVDEQIIVPGTHEAIIPPPLFERAQRVMRVRAGEKTAEQRRASRRNSPYMLSGLIRCSRCGSRWEGRKRRKGKRRVDGSPVETFYYACGGYIRSGTSVCGNVHVPKDLFEEIVLEQVREQIGDFISDGGAAMLQALVVEEAAGGDFAEEQRIREELEGKRRRLDELVDAITPALAPVIEGKVVALRQEIERLEVRLEDMEAARVSRGEAQALVEGLVSDLARIGEVIGAADFLEQREIVRGLTQGIAFDPDTLRGEIAFYAVPLAARNDKRPGAGRGDFVSLVMAGARPSAPETTKTRPTVRKPFSLSALRACA